MGEKGWREHRYRDRRKYGLISSKKCSAQCEREEWHAVAEGLPAVPIVPATKSCREWLLELDSKVGI